MTSKKNRNLTRNLADEKQRFGIRKFSVGVASVLLGTSLMFGANTQIAHADSENGGVNSTTETTSEVQPKNENDAANTANVQNEVKATENKVETSNTENQSAKEAAVGQSKNSSEDQSTTKQEINNKKTESLEKKAPSIGSTTTDNKKEQKTSLEDKSEANNTSESKVEKANPVEVKSESHEDLTSDRKGTETQEIRTQTLKLTSATPLSAKALTESKAQNQDTVTAKVNLIDNDPNFGTGDTIKSDLTYTVKSGEKVSDIIAQVKKQLDQDTTDFFGPEDNTKNIPSAYLQPARYADYIKANPTWVDDWKKNKENIAPLAGYDISVEDNDNSDEVVTDGATYNLNIVHTFRKDEHRPFYRHYTRQIIYKMYGIDDQSIAPETATQYGTAVLSSLGDNFNRKNADDGQNEILYEWATRRWDLTTGLLDPDTPENMSWNGFIFTFDGEKSPTASDDANLSGWVPDHDVEATGATRRLGYATTSADGSLTFKNKKIDSIPNEYVIYYHNQPVDLSFEDISKIDPQDLSGNNYEASNELTYDNTASNQYDVYGALNKDGKNLSDVIKSIEDKGYKLVSITNDDDASQADLKDNSQINLTYDKDGVWKNDQLVHKRYTIKFVHDVKPTTENTSVSRNIHYVADEGNSKYEVLKDPDTQTVNFERTAYIDQVTKQEVIKNADGTYSELPANFKKAWKAVGTDNFDKIQKDRFNKNEGKVPGVWEIERANYDDPEGTQLTDNFAPEVANVDAAKTYNDIYLVYNKATAGYNIHYIDVSDSNKTSNFAPNDGNELPHEIKDIHGDIGDKSNATKDLWTTYGDDGYVAVGLSDNAQDGKLATQEFAEGMQDQYVYLKHKAVEITSKTPNPPKNSSVDPKDLTKSADRVIHYVTEKDKTPLLDDTTQKITFEGTAYIDVVNGKNIQTVEGTDAISGQKVLIALTTPGTVTWTAIADDGSTVDNNKGSFKQVTKPVITDGKLAGIWTVTDGTANNSKQDGTDLDPASSDFDPHREVTLEYTKDVNADIIYIDDTDNNVLIPTANDTDEHGKPGQDVHFAQDPQKIISDFEKQGYILVRDDFGKGQKYGDTDSHYEIHFVHGVTKDTQTQPVVRVIHYVTLDGDEVLLDPTTQNVNFTKTTYIDNVTKKSVGVKEVKDSEGNTVLASDNTETTPVWSADNNKDSFDQVTKPVITDGKLAGKWLVTEDTANNAPEFKVPDPSDPNFKESYDVTLKYVQTVDADIVYYDVTNGEDNKIELTRADDNNGDGKVGDQITFATMPKDQIKQFEDQGYVLVSDDFDPADPSAPLPTYKKTGNHFEVRLIHGTITTPTPKTPNAQKQDTTKTVTRVIKYFDAETHETVADSRTQSVTYSRTAVYDSVTGQFLGFAKITDGKVAQDQYGRFEVDPDLTDKNSWVAISVDKDYPAVDSPDLTGKGYDAQMSFSDKVNNGDAAQAPQADATPEHDGQEVDIYYFHGVDKKVEHQTVTRTIYYRGTSDGGKTYQDVEGLATKDKPLTQSVSFTRTAIIDKVTQKVLGYDTDGDGKVDTTIADRAWVTEKDSFDGIKSPAPSSKGYTEVDKDVQPEKGIKPTDKFDEPIVVTYSREIPTPETHTVTVHYVDEDGNIIKNPVKDSKDYKDGETYDENSKKDTTIEHDGKTYEFTRVKEGDNPTGAIEGKDVDVTYVYKLKEEPVTPPVEETYHVTVHYVDEDGNVIKDPVKDPADFKNGESYDENSKKDTTIEHDGKTYVFTRVKEGDNPTGTIPGKDVDVTYVYKLKEEPVTPPVENTYHVTVHYVDADGNVIKNPVKDSTDYKNGQSYDENSKKDSTIEHDGKTYVFTRVKEGDNPAGIIPGKDVDVTYVYKLKEEPVTPPVEETYNVTVHYVDEDGNVIKDPVKDSTDFKNGESYNENSKKDITIEHDGKTYVFTRVKEGDSPAGTIEGKDVDVTYVYKLKEEPVTPVVPPVESTYNVTVNFVDENGNVLQDSRHSSDHKNGTDYNESDHPTTITKDGKTYTYTRAEGDAPTGPVNGKDVVITYVYKEVATPVTPVVPPVEETHTVTVHYVDENGNVIKNPVKDSTDYKNGQSYDENSRKDATIEHDGKTYVFTRVQEGSNPTGTIEGKDVDVTYVYKLKETPATPVTPVTPVKPSDKPTTPVKDHDVQPSNTKVSTQNNSTTSTVKTLSDTTSEVIHSSTTPSPARQNNVTKAPSSKPNKLPQTGKKDTSLASILGLATLGVASVLTLFVDRKKKN